MYDSFYNLTEKPFSISTDPRFLWCSETHNEALANLKYGVMERNGFVVLTGDIGTGKTTLVNALLKILSDDVLIANINHPCLETTEFMTLVAKTPDPSVMVAGQSDLLLFFSSFLKKVHNEGKIVLLIVDEAHRLSAELLEEIRLLSNIEQDGTRLLRVREKIKSHFIHLGFRPSSPNPGVAKSSKELAIPTVLPPPDRTNLTQIQAPKM